MLWARFTLVAASITFSMAMGDWFGRYVLNPARRRLLLALGFSLACIILSLIIFVPAQVQLQPAFPEIRDWLRQNPVGLAGLFVVFFMVFWIVGHIKLEKRYIEEWIPYLLMLLIFSLCLVSLPQLFITMPVYQLRAQLWDWRDAQIYTAIRLGTYDIELPALDSIAGVTELQADPGHWVNNCAELYYGMKSIKAVPPVLTAVPDE